MENRDGEGVFVNERLAFGSAITSSEHVENLRTQGITHLINLRLPPE